MKYEVTLKTPADTTFAHHVNAVDDADATTQALAHHPESTVVSAVSLADAEAQRVADRDARQAEVQAAADAERETQRIEAEAEAARVAAIAAQRAVELESERQRLAAEAAERERVADELERAERAALAQDTAAETAPEPTESAG